MRFDEYILYARNMAKIISREFRVGVLLMRLDPQKTDRFISGYDEISRRLDYILRGPSELEGCGVGETIDRNIIVNPD